ncbi:MAG: hypothetical protein IJH22_06735 [Firmicutes bacterium]|nr:hypothetical protein [Bacillota bacterium]
MIRKHTKPKLQILMLGNSLTAANQMPVMLAKELGAEPVIYATWAFRPGCEKLDELGMDATEQ